MRKNLPRLNQERLDMIFARVYPSGVSQQGEPIAEDRIQALIDVLRAMQTFNYHYRVDDTNRMFDLFSSQFNFEMNSEGTTLWLAMILAIQELYGFTDGKLVEVMRQVTVNK